MASIFGDDGDDLLNANLPENQELPSDDDDNRENGENLFTDVGEAAEDAARDDDGKAVKIEPKKRTARNPRPRLTLDTLCGPRGIHTIEDYFKDIKFHGKGHEKRDLDEIMHRLQHWGHRMYPNYKFDDILGNIERLGKKKTLQVHMSRYRLGMLENLRDLQEQGLEDVDDDGVCAAGDEPFDEFDALLGEQIAISKMAPCTPATFSSSQRSRSLSMASSSTFATPPFHRETNAISTPYTVVYLDDTNDLATPLPPSQPNTPVIASKKLSSEQLAKIAENRRLAQERLRIAKEHQLRKQLEVNIEVGL